MPTKKPKTGSRTRSRKRRAAEPAPALKAAPRAPKLGATLDPEDVQAQAEAAQGRSAGQAGSLQGLPDVALAAPESVDELLEEGNTFEAEAVAGVENAPDADQGEVKTHEFPEDDVPEEYLDSER